MTRPRHHLHVAANLFGIPLGLCGLAQAWTVADRFDVAEQWPADALWVVAAAVWVVVAAAYFGRYHRRGDLARELASPTVGPFVAVAAIVPMLLGAALARHAPLAGHIIFWIALAVTVVLGGWLIGQWMTSGPPLGQWHPGYFLPTVGGGLVASIAATTIGQHSLGMLLFGYGVVSWLILGPIIRLRLFTEPALPVPLRSSLAIELAPPVIAGTAWFQLNGDRVDAVALLLGGYAFLMVIVQLRLIPVYRTIPFGPAWWGFSFPYAAAAGYAIRWLAAEEVPALSAWTWAVLIVVTAAAMVLIVRTIAALAAHRFLPVAVQPTGAVEPTGAVDRSSAVVGSGAVRPDPVANPVVGARF